MVVFVLVVVVRKMQEVKLAVAPGFGRLNLGSGFPRGGAWEFRIFYFPCIKRPLTPSLNSNSVLSVHLTNNITTMSIYSPFVSYFTTTLLFITTLSLLFGSTVAAPACPDLANSGNVSLALQLYCSQ